MHICIDYFIEIKKSELVIPIHEGIVFKVVQNDDRPVIDLMKNVQLLNRSFEL
jgi:hypothetical protein